MILPCVILAGGRASRMGGGDKGKLVLGGRSLFDRVIDQIGPQVDLMAINANGLPVRLMEFGLPVLPDTVMDDPGPLAGILVAMDWAALHGAEQVITIAADTPFFPSDLVMRLQRGGTDAPNNRSRWRRPRMTENRSRIRPAACGTWPCAAN